LEDPLRALVVLNPRSGSLARRGIEGGNGALAASLSANGITPTIAVVSGKTIPDVVLRAIRPDENSSKPSFDVIIVGGGDGSIGAAASVLASGNVPLGILPLGTFNHFARDLGLPFDLEAAVQVIARGRVTFVDVGEVNGRVFLNNSSLGIYPHLVAERDRQRRHGLARWGAAALAFWRVLWRLPKPRVRVLAPGWETVRRTPCLFIGNNLYTLNAFAFARRSRLGDGELCLYIANRQGRLALIPLALRAFLGRLVPDRDFTLARLTTVEIWTRRRLMRVALDGESLLLPSPLRYRIRPRALRVIAPEPIP
jgi:diacylglycerol kinase family enzyme